MRAIVRATNDAFSDAIARGDAAVAAAVYAEDARLLPPGAGPLGRAAAERFWRSRIDTGICGVELKTLELEQQDDTAYEIGDYVLASAPAGDEPTIERGKHVVIHKRQADGSWKWAVDIFNANARTDPAAVAKEEDER